MPWIESQIEQQNVSLTNQLVGASTNILSCHPNCIEIVPKNNGKILTAAARSFDFSHVCFSQLWQSDSVRLKII